MTIKVIALLLALSFVAQPAAGAQSEEAPAGVLDLSRDLRDVTREVAGQSDLVLARRSNEAALALQPGHPGLLNNALLLSGMAGDLEGQLQALERIAQAGLAFDLNGLDTLAQLQETAPVRLAAIRSRLDRHATAQGRAETLLTVPLADSLIEAIAVDIETERVFLGGVADRTVYVFEHGSSEPQVFAGPEDGLYSVFALAIDGRNRLLYVASGSLPQTPLRDGEAPGTALFAFDLMTGGLMTRHEIEGAGRITDVTVRDGVVYAVDGGANRVYRLRGPLAEPETVATHPHFGSLQGIVVTGGAIWVADYAMGLWRIDPDTGRAQLVPAPQASLIGLDGLATGPDGTIYAVRNGAEPMGVFRIAVERGSIRSVEPELTLHPAFGEHGEPTTLNIENNRAFLVANAQWSLFPETRDPAAESSRVPPVVLTWPVGPLQ
ncbi:hypothetical protein [Marinicauda sp. Alg238-R41]|uniref:hypothetical protein n=1 Tax=Marinicauda sp. Alg238-R41 TaxID=2993447 RepID=UPI0022DF2B9B|nr:hypothetical protein [Marinicauda sp. Alg238-R41]